MVEMIIQYWLIILISVIVFMFTYWRLVFRGTIDIFDVSISFYHKYLLEEESLFNKIYFTKKNTLQVPRFKQIAWLLMILFIDVVLMIIIAFIGTITMQEVIVKLTLNFVSISAIVGMIIWILGIIVVYIQAKKCAKNQKLLNELEISRLIKEIGDKHPNFWA
ncbi:hypothetical protein N7603_06085 [Acholeplasma vituli]|uniref:Uncharacterized protein n=1 Tax=Paracholeplasma vituli TaxID=69473 RepID=A0ABT2PWC1_9MOLU|nr:hypothetical protein [Paracholeplasma vituli]MCU0105222.1 hypothetical protein [Paracholeplasma vituli]